MRFFRQPISEYIWNLKYRYYYDQFIDQNIDDTWQRIAHAVASVEEPHVRKDWQKKFYQLLENFCFLPGGRIMAGAGTEREVTLFNCFAMQIAEDSLSSIFDALKEGAITLQQGGGIGCDFSIIRPNGQIAQRTGATATGPVSFMRIWDSMSATIQSSGQRRGAMMATLRCDHPDIEEFIAAKADPTQLRHFNVSVIVTDEFMQAVQADAEWALVFPLTHATTTNIKVIQRRWSGSRQSVPCQVYRYVKARDLWQKIIKAAYDYSEPGVLFEDTINRLNPLWYCEWLSTTNPCGEIPLPPYGACNLGSINLTQFILNPFTEKAQFNWQKLTEVSQQATRFLDNVISVSKYPLPAQTHAAQLVRRIGLGFTGLADTFIMLGLRYGEPASLQLAGEISKTIAWATWETSIELAKEKGVFPAFDAKCYLQGEFVQHLPVSIRQSIQQYGIRNSHHNAIAPTGTISILANNVSSGLEPIFSASYQRTVRMENGELKKFKVDDYAYAAWKAHNNASELPPAWSDVQTLSPDDHLNMQAAVQPYVDNAISKTINIPEDFPFEKLMEVYTKAYQLGLKGCTIYRPNQIRGSIITANSSEEDCCN